MTELNRTEVGRNFSSKEQASFNFMAVVTICSDFPYFLQFKSEFGNKEFMI